MSGIDAQPVPRVHGKVLLVDDEPAVLEALRRLLSSVVAVETATNGAEGLSLIESSGPFAVVISDMGMPGMNGAEFLHRVQTLTPDSVRIILTGQAELESTIAAVNLGRIFRFLTKPCRKDELLATLKAGLDQYSLVIAQRELLEQTLHGTVEVLTEIIGLANPLAQKRAARMMRYAEEICAGLAFPMPWQLRIALMLSQIGCITLPEQVLSTLDSGGQLSDESNAIYRSHPALAGKLLGGIPRLEPVAEIVARQHESLDLAGEPEDFNEWDVCVFGTMILRICGDLDDAVNAGLTSEQAFRMITEAIPRLPPPLLRVLRTLKHGAAKAERSLLKVSQLQIGMVLDEDVTSANGMRLVAKGQEVTRSIMLRLQSFADGVGVTQPFWVSHKT